MSETFVLRWFKYTNEHSGRRRERQREGGRGGGVTERESLSEPSSRRTAALTVDPLSVWPG